MLEIPDILLPPCLELSSVERNAVGETNDVFSCKVRSGGRTVDAYIKAGKHPGHCLANERAVLDALADSGIPVPHVLWYGESGRAALVIEALPGRILWDFIDPRRGCCQADQVPAYLHAYGRCLAAIHRLPLAWETQKRPRLGGFIGEENVADPRFGELVRWLQRHAPPERDDVFVHGDLNTASVLFLDGALSGVVDWEFAGRGWREYDLAWLLRARTAFLNTPAERDAILDGYRELASYDEDALRWCEVLNYLHFAYWSRASEPPYTAFALGKASETAGLA